MPLRTVRTFIAGQQPLTVPRTMTVADVAQQMKAHGKGACIVVEGSRLIGIFTERDALFRVIAARLDPTTTAVGSVMTRDPQTIHPDRSFVEALRMMYEGRYRHMPVVEDGRPLGMVSSRDALAPELHELRNDLEMRDADRE